MNEQVIKLHVKISTRAAIVAGNTALGTFDVSVTAEMLAGLSKDLREEVAFALEAGEPIESDDPPVVAPTFDAVLPVLRARAAAREAEAQVKRATEARRAEEAVVEARAVSQKDVQRQRALRAWVEQNGDDAMKARMAEGYLPSNETLDAVAAELLDMPMYEAYQPLYKGEACDCKCAGAVVFSRGAPSYLDGYQHAIITGMREAAPTGATVEPVEHKAKCPKCNCAPIGRIAGKISLPWEGWLLVREFLVK